MSYPHDADLDADTLALLAGFRKHAPRATPDPRMAELLRDDMPVDLKAWLDTYAQHGALVSVGDAWFETASVQPLRDVVEAFQARGDARLQHERTDGLALDDAIVMGNTADGEVFYAAAWRPGARGLTLVRFCVAGYDDDGYRAMGGLVNGLRSIADAVEDVNDIDEGVRAVLIEGRDDET